MAKTDALNTTDVANTITVAAATATVAAAASNTTAVTVPAVSNENRLMKLKQKEMLLARLEKHRATIIKQKWVVVSVSIQLLYTDIDQTLWISFQGLLNCEIGWLDCHFITTEYRKRVRCIQM